MAVIGPTQTQYAEFLENGGTLVFTIDSIEISSNNSSEDYSQVKPYLYSGFELEPSSIIHDPKYDGHLLLHGDSWSKVVTSVHRLGGKIIYKKLTTGNYQAECTVPA